MNTPIRQLQDTRPAQRIRRPHQAGVSLIESLMVLAVTAVALGAAVPGFESARERRHVEGVAAQLETDIQHARSLAVARSQAIRISFSGGAGDSCYVVHTGAAEGCRCAPSGEAVCEGGAQALQTAHWPAAMRVRISANVKSMVFEPARGTVTPAATVKVQGTHTAVHQVVNIMGRVRSCTPASAPLPGYRTC